MRKLTEGEKREIMELVASGKPLPIRYRSLLFENGTAVELVWDGKGEVCAPQASVLLLEQRYGPCFENTSASPPDSSDDPPVEAGKRSWRNKLIWGDNAAILAACQQGIFRREIGAQGGIRLIYIDPPFFTDADFPVSLAIGDRDKKAKLLAFTDRWREESAFLTMMQERLTLMRELLSEDGSIYVHCDWRMNSCLRLLLDEIFGHYVNEICWHYTGGGRARGRFSRKHDSILVYSKSGKFIFNRDAIRVPYKPTSSYAKSGIRAKSGKTYLPNPKGTVPDDVWDLPIINPLSKERLGYPTQKPENLLERIILASSNPGDLVADFFCGSGTFPAVAARLGRNWLATDIGRLAIHITRKRLLASRGRSGQGAGFELWSAANGEKAAFSQLAQDKLHYCGNHINAEILDRNGLIAVRFLGFQPAPDYLQKMRFLSNPCSAANNAISCASCQIRNKKCIAAQVDNGLGFVDYWAVDFGLPSCLKEGGGQKTETGIGNVFHSDWQTWRGNGHAALELTSPYCEISPGCNEVAIEVGDIFGGSTVARLKVSILQE